MEQAKKDAVYKEREVFILACKRIGGVVNGVVLSVGED